MLKRAAQRGRTVGEPARPLRMSFSAASQHVRVLERAGLAGQRIAERRQIRRLTPAPPAAAADRWRLIAGPRWRKPCRRSRQAGAALEHFPGRVMTAETRPHETAQALRYRPEIDGLRALAILPVLFFHYRVAGFGGGFVGVDVFFVISGFLITSLIAGEMDRGRFGFAHFYERRIRRIFPALFAMLAVASAVAVVILFPVDLVRYARSLFATSLFGSNVEFWREAGYFDVAAEEKPLLHLWSIAVEEQFYLLFPALLLFAGKRRVAAVATIFALSFGFAAWGVAGAPTATFYLLPGRAWELMLGALIATAPLPALRAPALREALAAAGIAMIAAAVFAFTRDTPFPGPAALLPCLGTALVIWATGAGPSLAGRALALAPVAFVGRISYSLYLWHWPLYVFARYRDFRDPAPAEIAVLIVASFALASASWYFVEQPIRRRTMARSRLFAGGLAAMAVCGALALVVMDSDGFPARLSPRLRAILAEEGDHEPRLDDCLGISSAEVRAGRLCRIGAPHGAPSFLLWGDSHADAMLPAIEAAARKAGRAGLFAGGRSCPPLLDVITPMADCRPFNDAMLAVARRPGIDTVILDARWAKYAEGATYGTEPSGRVVLADAEGRGADDNHDVFARGLSRTVDALAGRKIVIVSSVPEIGWPVPSVLAREALASSVRVAPPDRAAFLARQKFVLSVFATLYRPGLTVIRPDTVLCPAGPCQIMRNGIPLYRDEHHLSVYGARLLAPLFAGAL